MSEDRARRLWPWVVLDDIEPWRVRMNVPAPYQVQITLRGVPRRRRPEIWNRLRSSCPASIDMNLAWKRWWHF